jgi:hypothetical protein
MLDEKSVVTSARGEAVGCRRVVGVTNYEQGRYRSYGGWMVRPAKTICVEMAQARFDSDPFLWKSVEEGSTVIWLEKRRETNI